MISRLMDFLVSLAVTPNTSSHFRAGYYGNEAFYGSDSGYEPAPPRLVQDIAASPEMAASHITRDAAA